MKKTYQIPTIEVIQIETAQMIAESALGVGNTYGSGDVVLSRDGSGWDDDEY